MRTPSHMLCRLCSIFSVALFAGGLSAHAGTIGLDMEPASAQAAFLAKTSAGNAAIIRVKLRGPEGGGSINYVLADVTNNTPYLFHASNDFSPGDGSTPQQISRAECRSDAKKANRTLKKLGFASRFDTNCADDRSNLLKIAEHESAPPAPEEALAMLKTLNVK